MRIPIKRSLLLTAAGLSSVLLGNLQAQPEHVELESVWNQHTQATPVAETTTATIEAWIKAAGSRANVPASDLESALKSLKQTPEGWLAEGAGLLFVANADTGLLVTGWNKGQPSLCSIYHFPTGTEWLSGKTGSLWEIAYKTPGDVTETNLQLAAPACSIRPDANSFVLEMKWPASGHASQVSVDIVLSKADSVPQFKIHADPNPTSGIWSVRFPILHGVGSRGKADALTGTLGTSRLIRKFSGEIRDHLFGEQLRALTMGDSTLYVSTEDPRSMHKYYNYLAGGDLSLLVLPDDMGVAGKPYHQDFPTRIGPIRGDWYEAAQRYRAWALQQKWVKRGKVETWQGSAKEMASVMLWAQTLSPLANNVIKTQETLIDLNKRLGVPMGTHYYQWWIKDAFSPTVLTAGFKKGLPEAWQPLRENGIAILPYFNVLYWKAGWRGEKKETEWPNTTEIDPGFAKAKEAACQPLPGMQGDDAADEKFRAYEDYYIVYGGNNVMVPMCRLTPLWQEHVLDLAKLMVKSGNDLVYLDQGGVPPRSPCFNPNHGHKMGGGGQWAEGTREMMRRIKFDTGKEVAICCEGAYEGYLDLVENQFMHYWPWLSKKDTLCPLFETVYHDYTLFIGAVKPHPDATAYAIDVGTRLLHGNQFRADAAMFGDPKYTDQSAFIDRMAKLRQAGAPFLVAGQLIRPPNWNEAPGRVKAEWIYKNGALQQTIGYAAMERAAFRTSDGKEAVFIVNFSNAAQEAKLALAGWSKGAEMTALRSDGTQFKVQGDTAFAVPARDGLMITLP